MELILLIIYIVSVISMICIVVHSIKTNRGTWADLIGESAVSFMPVFNTMIAIWFVANTIKATNFWNSQVFKD